MKVDATREGAREESFVILISYAGLFYRRAQQRQQTHGKQIGSRDYRESGAKPVVGHDSAGDHRPEWNRNEADKIIETKSRVEKVLADQIGEQSLGQRLARRDRGAVDD